MHLDVTVILLVSIAETDGPRKAIVTAILVHKSTTTLVSPLKLASVTTFSLRRAHKIITHLSLNINIISEYFYVHISDSFMREIHCTLSTHQKHISTHLYVTRSISETDCFAFAFALPDEYVRSERRRVAAHTDTTSGVACSISVYKQSGSVTT